jgi:probable F420-dependent oxidoreductase
VSRAEIPLETEPTFSGWLWVGTGLGILGSVRIGVDLPYFEDPGAIRAFAQAVEEIGFHHLGFSEHVVSARGTAYPPNFATDDPWHESFTLLGFVSAVTSRIELNPAMVLLTLRPTVLAAKQAAEIDLLSSGRLRIAASVGWNLEELRAHGVDPATRAALFEEQVVAMRRLWTEDTVDFAGTHVQLDGVSLHPRPKRSIPLWFGAGNFASGGVPNDRSVDRMARLADGYKMFAPLSFDVPAGVAVLDRLRAAVAHAGRDVASFGLEARLAPQAVPEDEWISRVQVWKDAGATHLGLANRLGAGSVDQELERLQRFANATRHLW